MHMPDMNGLQVQAALTQMDISMPVVMLTGNGDIALAVQAMKAGAVDFLAKPIERALLLDAIDRAFARIDTAEGRARRSRGMPTGRSTDTARTGCSRRPCARPSEQDHRL
jgi:FixJ family two-component response regulator